MIYHGEVRGGSGGQNHPGGKINQGLSLYKHTGAHVRTRTATQGGWPQIKWIKMGKNCAVSTPGYHTLIKYVHDFCDPVTVQLLLHTCLFGFFQFLLKQIQGVN